MKVFVLSSILLILSFSYSSAEETFSFGPKESKITGSIKYTVIGQYRAVFEKFDGTIGYDPEQKKIKSVYLKINAGTIKSGFNALDKIVRSPRLLSVVKYPYIIFEGKEVLKEGNQFRVKGVLDIRGVRRTINFPFEADSVKMIGGREVIKAKGKWIIPRKEYDIIWNKVLDQGGVLVGNYITVEWEVNAFESDATAKLDQKVLSHL